MKGPACQRKAFTHGNNNSTTISTDLATRITPHVCRHLMILVAAARCCTLFPCVDWLILLVHHPQQVCHSIFSLDTSTFMSKHPCIAGSRHELQRAIRSGGRLCELHSATQLRRRGPLLECARISSPLTTGSDEARPILASHALRSAATGL